MAQITLRGNPINTVGDLPAVGSSAPAFVLTGTDLGTVSNEQFKGRRCCSTSSRRWTPRCARPASASSPEQALPAGWRCCACPRTCRSRWSRFCGAEGIENVTSASAFRDSFGEDYGLTIADGPMAALLGVVVVIGLRVAYAELVPEIAQEPDYEAALAAAG